MDEHDGDGGENVSFDNIGQQLTNTLEEVDQHFETLFQAIEDRFILSSSSSGEEEGEMEEEEGAQENVPENDAEVDQICRTNWFFLDESSNFLFPELILLKK